MSVLSKMTQLGQRISFGEAITKRPLQIWERLFDFSSRSRRTFSEHRNKRRESERAISDRSRSGLDWTNFFVADVQMGFGAFLAFYLAGQGWSKENVGLALTTGAVAGLLTQIPGGALADTVHWKRGLAAAGIAAIAVSALILALWPTFPMVFVAEVLHGVASGVIGTTIAAISLGIAGRQRMSARVGRNYRFSAAGNALTAATMGVLGTYVAMSSIFLGTALLCIPTLFALSRIEASEIDYIRARNAARRDHTFDLQRIIDVGKNRNLLLLAGCLVLFYFSNASLLPLLSQNLAKSHGEFGPLLMAGLVAGPQILVALLAPWVGYWSEMFGRKPLLMAAFATEALRAVLFTFVSSPTLLLLIQLLDGITGALIAVLVVIIITDLTTGSGRFNLTQGVIGALTATASALSASVMGFIASRAGDAAGFLTMASATCLGLAVILMFLPETKPAKYLD